MTFIREAMRDRPIGLYELSSSSPYLDASGYGRNAAATGSEKPGAIGIVAGASSSRVLDSTTGITYNSPVFTRGAETKPFVLEAWVRVFSESRGNQLVLGHADQMDGLVINGTKVSFVIKFTSAPTVTASFDFQQGQVVHLVGVYTSSKISLFVNGELASETSFTDDHVGAVFASSSSTLSSGTTTSSQKIAINGVAMYANAINGDSIKRHYLAGTAAPDFNAVSGFLGGDRIVLSSDNANMFIDYWWKSTQDWNNAEKKNVTVDNDILKPQYINDIPSYGLWMDSVPLDALEETSIYGMQMNWDGFPTTVEASIDNNTWSPVVRGRNISVIPPGFNPANKELLVKVSFAPGFRVSTDESYNSSAYTTPGGIGVYNNRWPTRGEYTIGVGSGITSDGFFRYTFTTSGDSTTFGYHLSGNTDVTTSSGAMPVVPGESYYIASNWRDKVTSAEPIKIRVAYYDSAGARTTSFNLVTRTSEGANNWTPINGVATIPDDVFFMAVDIVRTITSVSGETIDISGTEIRTLSDSSNPREEEPYLDNLNIMGFKSGTAPAVAGRTITLTSAFQEREHQPLELHDNSGVEISTGGSIVISGDTSDEANPARTIEILFKRPQDATGAPTSMTGTHYKNGVPGSTTTSAGEWVLMHTVASSDVTGSITINGPMQIAHIAIYPTALSATDIASIYATLTQSGSLVVDDEGSIVVTAPADLVRIYAADWSITAAG